ncbi:calcium-binding protein [Arsenophonus sp. PmNCSU2021_1]|uniref:calcium-binding protein n=1 Tax=Arsenophonus sp. PmNCSU2021_1 TaxID=3118989 RepID=UPI002FF24FEE
MICRAIEGQDIYAIERYNRNSYQDRLPWLEQHYYWDANNEQWQTLNTINTELKSDYDFAIDIVIDEVEKESGSIVNLNYQLDEIKEIKLIDGDIYLQILLDDELIDSEIQSVKVNLRLKNVYISLSNDEYDLNHQYLLQTMDGFLLSMCLPQKLTKQTTLEKIFETMYFEILDKVNNSLPINEIEIDLSKNSIKTSRENYLLPDMIKPMISVNNGQHTVFHGDKSNNYFTSIKKNNYIYFSHGIDIYLLDDLVITDNINDSVTFDFKEMTGSYTNEDIFIIVLKDYSGYDFTFNQNKLFYQGSTKLVEIKFINNVGDFYDKIYLLDKNNEYFAIEYQEKSYQITPCITVAQPSEFDDVIFYPKDYSQIIKVNLSAGNDILTDMSETGKIILAGEGNDIITVRSGNNVIIDGSGNDTISTGEGNDIIISTHGNNVIDAGRDNNVIVVNYAIDDIEIFLQPGNNKIFAQGLARNSIFDYSGNNLILSSKDNNKKIIIYDYEKYKDNVEINTSLNNSLLLVNKDVELLINAASAFQQKDINSLLANLTVAEESLINQIYHYNKLS